MAGSYWIETLGCPKNQVDSDKLAGSLLAEGYSPAAEAEAADLVVVNTCAFIDSARAESIETILALGDARQDGARLVVTGCLAARSGAELVASIPAIEVVDVGVPVHLSSSGSRPLVGGVTLADPGFDLLEHPRPRSDTPWAYVKIAEGCDRRCGFCAIPSFRGPQRSRSVDSILREVGQLGAREIVLVAQDLASYGRDQKRSGALIELVEAVARDVDRVRLLYLYPSALTNELIDAIIATGVSYFDLSLQHVSPPLVRRMRRFGNASRFLERIERIRRLSPEAAMRSSFILGYPGETEEDHDQLLAFLEQADLDWAGFFTFSPEDGTYATGLDGQIDPELALERLRECAQLQDAISARRRRSLVGSVMQVLVDEPGVARSHREAPEIDGIIRVPLELPVGEFAQVLITEAEGTDLVAVALGSDPNAVTAVLQGARAGG